MNLFKGIMNSLCTTLGCMLLGCAIAQTICGNYMASTIMLFVVSGLYIVGYFTERFSKEK